MPRGDGTGPNGAGRMTGRGVGYCTGNNAPGYANPNTTTRRGNGIPNAAVGYGRGGGPAFGGGRQIGLGIGRGGYGFRSGRQ